MEAAIRYSRVNGQIRQMVATQNKLNSEAYAETWLASGSLEDANEATWDYPLAAAMEIGEFLNSWGYDWWGTKVFPRTEPIDRQNCLTELVDAWHFIMSQALIEECGDEDRTTIMLTEAYARAADRGLDITHRGVVNMAKGLMAALATYEGNPDLTPVEMFDIFFTVVMASGFSVDHFTTRYLAKAQLNLFRQLNGYKDKPRTYQKNWEEGKEDNYFLSSYIDKAFAEQSANPLQVNMPSLLHIMQWIGATYTSKTGKPAVLPRDVEEEVETE